MCPYETLNQKKKKKERMKNSHSSIKSLVANHKVILLHWKESICCYRKHILFTTFKLEITNNLHMPFGHCETVRHRVTQRKGG